MKWKLKLGIILCVFTTGIAAYLISNHRAIDTPIKDIATPKDTAEKKTEIQPVTADKKMKQADFDRIMSEVATRNPTQNPVTTSDKTTPQLDPNSKWMPWEEYKNASPEARKAMTDQFKAPGSIEADVQRLIKAYDENFDLEAVIEKSPKLQTLREKLEQTIQSRLDTEKEIETLKNYGTFLFNEAKARGAVLIYDENGLPIGYEKDEQGNPTLTSITENTRPSENEPKANKTVPIQTPAPNNNVPPTISD